MELNVNQTARTLVASRDSNSRLGTLTLHQGDRFTISVWLLDETGSAVAPLEVAAMDAEYTHISVAARATTDLDEDLLFSATAFAQVGEDDELHYEATLNLNTEQIAALFTSDTTKTAAALLDIELSNDVGDKRLTVVGQWPVTIQRDLYAGTEGVPTDGEPAYPAADAIALKAPTDGGYRINGVNLQLWNTTQGKYQTVFLVGAAGAETIAIGDEA
jgi:hypothetical protein